MERDGMFARWAIDYVKLRVAPVGQAWGLAFIVVCSMVLTDNGAAWASEDPPADVTVYKLETCTCCRPWIRYLEREGFRVTYNDVADLVPVRKERSIPQNLESCHTAEVGGYLIEGHVPADDIRRLLAERPPIKLLSVPGMPAGPPGMDEGPGAKAYDVIALYTDGHTEVYSHHEPYGVESAAAGSSEATTPAPAPASQPDASDRNKPTAASAPAP